MAQPLRAGEAAMRLASLRSQFPGQTLAAPPSALEAHGSPNGNWVLVGVAIWQGDSHDARNRDFAFVW